MGLFDEFKGHGLSSSFKGLKVKKGKKVDWKKSREKLNIGLARIKSGIKVAQTRFSEAKEKYREHKVKSDFRKKGMEVY